MNPMHNSESTVAAKAAGHADGAITTPPPPIALPSLAVPALLLVALNLRPALASLAPVLAQVRDALGLSSSSMGVLNMAMVACLGLAAPLAQWLSRRWPAERVIGATLLLLAAGVALRGGGSSLALFAGSLIAGAAIGILGIVLPGLIKRDYPRHISRMTGLYTMTLCLGAALAAGLTVPMLNLSGGSWQAALGLWATPALLATIVWAWAYRAGAATGGRATPRAASPAARPLWRQPLAWHMTVYMGLQSSLAYCVFAWLPTMLIERGATPLHAGALMSVSVLAQLVTAFTGPWLATHIGRDQRPAALAMLSLSVVGLLGCLLLPVASLPLWVVVLGLGQGGNFSVALLCIVLRARDSAQAGRLSAMSQGVGYCLAAIGPLGVGLLRDATDGWIAVAVLFTGLALGAGMAAWNACQASVLHD
jgi:CP family cyanate transporter-like MFS transporter